MARVAVVGSREFPDLEAVDEFVDSLPEGTVIVSGGARGVDRRAAARARVRGLEVVEYFADWSLGRGAGHLRNTDIIEDSDTVAAFWFADSKGTADSIRKARERKKPTKVFRACEKCRKVKHEIGCPGLVGMGLFP